jgi:hypothetical protein
VKERKLRNRAIDEFFPVFPARRRVYRPRTDTERKQLDDLLASGTDVVFGFRDEEERRQYAERMAAAAAAAAAARVKERLLESEEQELDRGVWLVLKLLLGESLDGPLDKDQTLQSEKLYYRWSAVAVLHKEGLAWESAYRGASRICRRSSYAGSPRTMKRAYLTVERIRRTVRRAQSQS